MTPDPLTEIFMLWPAYTELHEYLLTTDPRTSDPHDLVGPLCAYGTTRATCLLHAHGIGVSLAESATIAGWILAMATAGRRPRYGAELGLSAQDFGVQTS